MEWRTQSRRVTLTSCMDEMSAKHTDLSHAMRCAMSEYDDNTKLTRRPRAHSLIRCRVSCALWWSWLSRRHWCRTSHRSVHHAYAIPSFLLEVVVRLYLVIVNSDCSHNYCMLHIAKNGSFEVLSFHLPTVTVDLCQL